MNQRKNIHCPKCAYRPTPEDRWSCTPRCGTDFHTFWTGGVCPGCGVQWPITQCPQCDQYSPHKAWYHEPEHEVPEERIQDLETHLT